MDNPLFIFKDYNSILNEVSLLREQIIDYKEREDSKYEYNYMFDFDEILYDEFIHYNAFDSIDTSDFYGIRKRLIMELLYATGIRVSELVKKTPNKKLY